MINIIFLVLKSVGILLLAVIALLLLILLAVLLVPIRYTIRLEHGDCFYADCRVNWLLHLVNAKVSYSNGKLHIRVRLLIFTLYDNLKPKRRRKPDFADKPEHKSKRVPDDSAHKNQIEGAQRKAGDDIKRAELESGSEKKTISKSESLVMEQVTIPEDRVEARLADKDFDNSRSAEENDTAGKAGPAEGKSKRAGFSIINKIKNIIARIKAFFKSIWDKIAGIFKSASDIWEKIKLVTEFLQDMQNREGIRLTYTESKRLLKHILPVKLKSTLRFGTGDPCSTGQALGAASILYSFYGDNISITPDFENKVFEGKHYARGRISLITILVIVIRLIRDERFKRLKRNFQLLKEAL